MVGSIRQDVAFCSYAWFSISVGLFVGWGFCVGGAAWAIAGCARSDAGE